MWFGSAKISVGGFQKGEAVMVTGRDENGQVMVASGRSKPIPLSLGRAKDFEVYERRELKLTAGDRIRITRNREAEGGKSRLANGSLHTVDGFNKSGDIRLDNGQVIPKDWGHISHGYYSTSYGSQGKTIDRVLVAVGPESFAAASKQQFYVSVSRGTGVRNHLHRGQTRIIRSGEPLRRADDRDRINIATAPE